MALVFCQLNKATYGGSDSYEPNAYMPSFAGKNVMNSIPKATNLNSYSVQNRRSNIQPASKLPFNPIFDSKAGVNTTFDHKDSFGHKNYDKHIYEPKSNFEPKKNFDYKSSYEPKKQFEPTSWVHLLFSLSSKFCVSKAKLTVVVDESKRNWAGKGPHEYIHD